MSRGLWWLWSPLPSSQGISFQLIKQQPAATTTKSCATCDYDEDWLDSWVIIFRETPFKHLNSACRLAWSGGGRVQQIDGKLCNKLRTRSWHRTYWLLLLLFRLNCILNNPPPFHTFWAMKLFELSPPTTQCPYNPLGHEIFLFINVTFEHQTTDQQSSCPPFIREREPRHQLKHIEHNVLISIVAHGWSTKWLFFRGGWYGNEWGPMSICYAWRLSRWRKADTVCGGRLIMSEGRNNGKG